jgi:protocatechuate 3,4-dioxygenase alpha subunit
MSKRGVTPSQTVGPFFHPGLLRADMRRNVLVGPATVGERVRVEGRVLDGEGAPVPDAMVEVWQANAAGRYNHPADTRPLPLDPDFLGYGRSGTGEDGAFWFETIKPGPVPYDGQRLQAPHLVVTVSARGLLNHLVTRLYFGDEPANESDPILQRIDPARRGTLIARRGESASAVVYHFDIVLQGDNETVFFDV